MPEPQARIYKTGETFTPEEKLTTTEQLDETEQINLASSARPRGLLRGATAITRTTLEELPEPQLQVADEAVEPGTPEGVNQLYDDRAAFIETQIDRSKPERQVLEPLSDLLTFIMLSADMYAGNMKFANYLLFQRPTIQKRNDIKYQMELNEWERGSDGRALEKSVRLQGNETARTKALLQPTIEEVVASRSTKQEISRIKGTINAVESDMRRSLTLKKQENVPLTQAEQKMEENLFLGLPPASPQLTELYDRLLKLHLNLGGFPEVDVTKEEAYILLGIPSDDLELHKKNAVREKQTQEELKQFLLYKYKDQRTPLGEK